MFNFTAQTIFTERRGDMAPCRQSCCCYSNKYHDVFGSTMPKKEFYSMNFVVTAVKYNTFVISKQNIKICFVVSPYKFFK